jgi:hypothetical protein
LCELAAGERIIVSPLNKPVLGMKIRVRGEDLAAAPNPASEPFENHPVNPVTATTLLAAGSLDIPRGGS